MTKTSSNPEFSDSPAEPDAPTEDTATSYPEGERLDPLTGEPVDPNAPRERTGSEPEHNRDGSRTTQY